MGHHTPSFSISSTIPPTPNSTTGGSGGHEIYHPSAVAPPNKLFNSYHRQFSHPTPPPPPHFPHFHSNIPITQQLFTPPPPPHHHHHFQLFQTNQHDHRRLLPNSPSLDPDPDPDAENSPLQGSGGAPPAFLPADMKFKLAVDESSGGGSRHAFMENASESRLRSWHREENCAIKEPFW